MLIQQWSMHGVGCSICSGPKGESNDMSKAGCFRESISTVNYNGDTNEKTVKVTLSSVAQTHSLSAGSQADKDYCG